MIRIRKKRETIMKSKNRKIIVSNSLKSDYTNLWADYADNKFEGFKLFLGEIPLLKSI